METIKHPVTTEHYIVAIGASAGGLEAIQEFFDNMPVSGKISFIIIQHLSPDYKSLLVELISKHTNMKVLEAGHDMKLEKNCVYVIPNNKLLTIQDCKLQLSNKHVEKAPNTAIDTFLKSLAQDQGANAIAVILSGTGTDGTKGIEAIQEKGGIVFVQDPVTAKFDGMPNSAIAAGYTDYILSPELIPEEIFSYIDEKPARTNIKGRPNEQALPEVFDLIEKHCGFDFHNYKAATILRRIARRMGILGKKNFEEYLDLLRFSSDECKILGKEFLIGVTKFFRDPSAFDIFQHEVLPQLVKSKEENDILKVWITACSTGQEAYSIAMLIDDYLRRSGKPLDVKIFATDIDIDAIEYAAKGNYPYVLVEDIQPEWLERYFVRRGESVSIVSSLRKQIVFARHNILKDPPFIKNDIVTCRNMLIYMNNTLQRKVLTTLQFSLNKGGFLFLGPSEIPGAIRDTLLEINGKWKIYKKVSEGRQFNPERFTAGYSIKSSREARYISTKESKANALTEDFKNLLTEEYGFAALYVDKNYEIKEAVGDFKKYLSLPDKVIHLNVLKMVHTDLSVVINTAIRKVSKENKKVVFNGIKVREESGERMINLIVRPATQNEDLLMIVFSEAGEVVAIKNNHFVPQHDPNSVSYITELEEELKETKLNLQMAVESLETTNEELQSSNEELLSANEELQSSNEELQSLNEELHTLNTEHQLRIKELIELNDDLNNYFRSTDIGQVFVDQHLRIRKFNTAAVRLINLIPTDIGRPIEHISNNIKDQTLLTDIKNVIRTQQVIEKEVRLVNGKISLLRILPYERQDSRVDGVVITFIDVTSIKELDSIVKGVFNTSLSAIMVFRAVREQGKIVDLQWTAGNYAADSLLRRSTSDYIGKLLKEVFPQLVKDALFNKYIRIIETEEPLHTEIAIDKDNNTGWFELVANKMSDGIVLTLTNITEKKLAEEKLRKNYQELIKTKENLKTLNNELEFKVRERTKDLTQSEERFRLIANATTDAIWDWNLVNNDFWWSESFYTLFGYHKDKEKNNSNFWLNQIHDEDREEIKKNINELFASGQANWSVHYRFRKKDGSYASILNRGYLLKDENGIPYRMIGSMLDMTKEEQTAIELKKKNDELHKLIEEFKFVTDFMPQMVWATQPDGYHDFYNKQWFDFTGLSFEQTKDKGWALVLHPEDFERTWKVWAHSLATGDLYETEYRMRRHDGVYRWFLARALPMRNEEGNIIKWFGTCTDIHDQKLINDILEQKVKERTAELRAINERLENSNTELLQFASVASHDLKEPLRKIHMFSNIIKDRYMKEADGAADYMQRIINSSSRMTKLINDLLTYTRLSVNGLFEKTNLNTIIEEVLSDLELIIEERNAVVEVAPLPELETVPGQMRQIFQNLISNSLKFVKKDVQPHIKIWSERIKTCSIDAKPTADGAYCRIILKDNGIGFDEQYSNKIFTIFQRLHSQEKYEGTGIGLAIAKKIIERHHGLINAFGKEGEGATFVIILPMQQVHTEIETD